MPEESYQADGEVKGDGSFRKYWLYVVGQAKKLGRGLGIRVEGLDKVVIADEKKKKKVECEPTTLIDKNGYAVKPDLNGMVDKAFGDVEWKEIETRSSRYKKVTETSEENQDVCGMKTGGYSDGVKASMNVAEIDAAVKNRTKREVPKTPEEILEEKIRKYDESDPFAYTQSIGDSIDASDGQDLLKALDTYKKNKYDKVETILGKIRHRYRSGKEPMPKQVKYLIGELKKLVKKKLEEQTTKRVALQERTGKRPSTKSKRWIDPKKGLVISSEITDEERKRVQEDYKKDQEIIKGTTDWDNTKQ